MSYVSYSYTNQNTTTTTTTKKGSPKIVQKSWNLRLPALPKFSPRLRASFPLGPSPHGPIPAPFRPLFRSKSRLATFRRFRANVPGSLRIDIRFARIPGRLS